MPTEAAEATVAWVSGRHRLSSHWVLAALAGEHRLRSTRSKSLVGTRFDSDGKIRQWQCSSDWITQEPKSVPREIPLK